MSMQHFRTEHNGRVMMYSGLMVHADATAQLMYG